MKRLRLSTIILLTTLTALCQTLKPIKIQREDTVYRCFDDIQSKAIIKYVIEKTYCDSMQDVSSQVIHIQDSIIKTQKEQNNILRTVIENDNVQIRNLDIINDTFRKEMYDCQDKLAVIKRRRWLYFAAGVVSASTVTFLVK